MSAAQSVEDVLEHAVETGNCVLYLIGNHVRRGPLLAKRCAVRHGLSSEANDATRQRSDPRQLGGGHPRGDSEITPRRDLSIHTRRPRPPLSDPHRLSLHPGSDLSTVGPPYRYETDPYGFSLHPGSVFSTVGSPTPLHRIPPSEIERPESP